MIDTLSWSNLLFDTQDKACLQGSAQVEKRVLVGCQAMVVLIAPGMHSTRPLNKDVVDSSHPELLTLRPASETTDFHIINHHHHHHHHRHNSVPRSRPERTRKYRHHEGLAMRTSESSDEERAMTTRRAGNGPDCARCFFTHLDEWSPNSVSVSALLSRNNSEKLSGSKGEVRRSSTNSFVVGGGGGHSVSGVASAAAATVADSRMETFPKEDLDTRAYSLMFGDENSRDRSLRRSLSCDPSGAHTSRKVYSRLESFTSSGIPRVYSAGDLESRNASRDRNSYFSENGFQAGRTPVHNFSLPGTLLASQTKRDLARKYYDENSLSNGYSSGYGSDTGDRNRRYSDCTHSSRAANKEASSTNIRATSADRVSTRLPMSRPFEYGPRGAMLVRRRSSQTLQTVVEHLTHVMAPDPQRPHYNSNSDSNSGANTPRSFDSNSRRSSLTSRNSYSDNNYSAVNSGFSDNYNIVSWADLQARLDLRLQGTVAETNTRLGEVSSSWNNDNANGRKISRSISSRPLPSQVWPRRSRSKSLPDLQVDMSSGGSSRSGNSGGGYSDDEDGDDFGFLSRRPPFSSFSRSAAAMHKPKVTAASPTQRLLPRRWRGKGKSSTSSSHPAQAMWTPEGPCTWCSVSGRKVLLKPVNILHLSEAERLTLQKISLAKLQAMDLACPIVIPKDAGDSRQHKKRTLSLKRRSKSANLSTLLDTLSADKGKDKENKDGRAAGLVFGIPLARCIANDQELLKRRARSETPGLQTRSESADQLLSPRQARKSSSSSQGSLDNGVHNGSITPSGRHSLYDSARRAQSSDSLSESEYTGRNASSSLIDALSLSMPSTEGERSQAVGSTPQVPLVVEACFKHLETYGLHVLGIFRVGSSKKRVKQLREEFDSGQDVQLTEEHNPHDVGALLKEFFRDLPEPLLTRDLYLPFVATRKLEDREQQADAVRLLLTLLPPANRDTLWALLRFLATVHRHSADATDGKGREVSGNKMDSHNLATLFGPNVLHRARAVNEKQFMAECAEQAEQSAEVISVVKDMIDNHYDLFEIAAEQRDEVLRLMMEADQENLDRALRRLAHENQIEPDPESTCSVFEDVEVPQSLPHSANSDADLLSLAQRRSVVHRPLRVSRSADPWTDPPQPDAERTSSVDSVPDRTSQSPSPQGSPTTSSPPRTLPACRPASITRPPLVTVSQESPNPEVVQRVTSGRRRNQDVAQPAAGLNVRAGVSDSVGTPAVIVAAPSPVRERPHSEIFSGPLVIPRPPYVRENSGSSTGGSGYPSSPGDHSSLLGSDCSGGQWGLPSPSVSRGTSPQVIRRSASSVPSGLTTAGQLPQLPQRRRRPHASSSRSDDDDLLSPPVGSPAWQRERWRHWEELTAGRNGATEAEQETLV